MQSGEARLFRSSRDSEGLRSLALIRPSAGSHALIERVGCEVRPAGPTDRAGLRIDPDLGKTFGGHGTLEDRAAHTVQNVDLAGHSIGEGKSQTPC
jgi:hypothetical protein